MLNIRHTGIVVSNLKKSKDFYCNLLGFKIQKEIDESLKYAYGLFEIPYVHIAENRSSICSHMYIRM